MAGVSAVAAGLLLLLLAFLCYRSTQGNTLIGEGKELDVLNRSTRASEIASIWTGLGSERGPTRVPVPPELEMIPREGPR
ncbi:unnamed protein product [Caretta caretta]